MKYNGTLFNRVAGKDLISKGSSRKKKPKRKIQILSLHESIKEVFIPVFTEHSLFRLSERIQQRRPMVIPKGPVTQYVVGQKPANWLDPNLIRHCIEDVRSNIAKNSQYSDIRKSLIVRGKVAYYVVLADYSIATLWLKPKHGYFKENGYQLASQRMVASYLRVKQLEVEVP